MIIQKNTDGTVLTLFLEGSLDSLAAPELEKELNDSMDDADELIIDFGKLEYISSAGLRVLLHAYQVMAEKNGMKIVHVNDTVHEVLQITGLASMICIVE